MLSNGQKTKLRALRAAMDGGVALAAAQGAAKPIAKRSGEMYNGAIDRKGV